MVLTVRKITAALGALSMFLASAGQSQSSVAPTPTTAAPACELHIWPTDGISAVTDDFGVPAGLLGDIDKGIHAKGDAHRTDGLHAVLGPAAQLDLLTSLDLLSALKVAPSKIIRHAAPLAVEALKGKPSRHSESLAGCYYELIVERIDWLHKSIYHPVLHVEFAILDFRAAPGRRHRGVGDKALLHFYPKAPSDIAVRDDELRETFKVDFLKFAHLAAH